MVLPDAGAVMADFPFIYCFNGDLPNFYRKYAEMALSFCGADEAKMLSSSFGAICRCNAAS
jgi:hypothetical protein